MESTSSDIAPQKDSQKAALMHPAYPSSDFIPVGHLIQTPANTIPQNPQPQTQQPVYRKPLPINLTPISHLLLP